jgi:hypothetical protein
MNERASKDLDRVTQIRVRTFSLERVVQSDQEWVLDFSQNLFLCDRVRNYV